MFLCCLRSNRTPMLTSTPSQLGPFHAKHKQSAHSAPLHRQKHGAPTPKKFLGHGIVDNVSRSITLAQFVTSSSEIASAAKSLFSSMAVPAERCRGVGIVVSRLDSAPGSAAANPKAPPLRSVGTFLKPDPEGFSGMCT